MLEITAAAQHLQQSYEARQSGLRVLIFEDKVRLATRPEYGEVIERWLTPQKRQALSQSAMETLSIIAYRQPITRADVEAIRGVKCEYALSVAAAAWPGDGRGPEGHAGPAGALRNHRRFSEVFQSAHFGGSTW